MEPYSLTADETHEIRQRRYEPGVDLLRGHARLLSAQSIQIGERSISAGVIVLASGGRAMIPQVPGATLGITSDGFFELPERPERVAVVGAGYIAAELSGISVRAASLKA